MNVPKIPVNAGTILAGTAAVIVIYFVLKHEAKAAADSAAKALAAAGNAVNPVSQGNLANKAVNGLTNAVTGDEGGAGKTFGTWLHSVFNPAYDNYNPNAAPGQPGSLNQGTTTAK
jgi:hypothetical protein